MDTFNKNLAKKFTNLPLLGHQFETRQQSKRSHLPIWYLQLPGTATGPLVPILPTLNRNNLSCEKVNPF